MRIQNNKMIRKALSTEAKQIAPLIFLAMEDISYQLVGEKSKKKAIDFLTIMIQNPNNQYSFENCWVFLENNEIVGAALVYDGAQLNTLIQPIKAYILEHFGVCINPEDETTTGEFYIDCVGVDPSQQGKGIGSQIFRFLIDKYVHQEQSTLGLLVDIENPSAKKLYLKLGFKIVGHKKLMRKNLEHLQISGKSQ